MAIDEIREGDVGTLYEGTVYDSDNVHDPKDISEATTHDIIFKKPDGELLSVTGSFTGNNGTDGVLRYIFVDGDIDQKGNWQAQAYLIMPSGKWKTDIDSFEVYPNL